MNKLKKFWSNKKTHQKIIIAASSIYLAAIALFVILHGGFFSPDQFYIYAIIFVLFTGQLKEFLKDWTPVILLILSYEYLRGIVPRVNSHVHFYLMPKFDQLIFQTLPTQWLQSHFYNPNFLHWYDFVAVFLYLLHFIVPLLTGFIFWLTDRAYFRRFMYAFIGLSYLTFLTYLLFPAAPPWMASQLGIISPITHITGIVLGHYLAPFSIPTVYQFFGANLTAAVPSLHAAYPLLTAVFLGKKYPKLIPILCLYVISVWFAVVYLAEHYFFDVSLGAVYAAFTFACEERFYKWRLSKQQIINSQK